jgi:membrane dipeptidase
VHHSRRKVLAVLAGAGGAMLLRSRAPGAAEADSRATRIIADTISIDMHNHVQIRFPKTATEPKPESNIDLAGQIRRSGFSALSQTFEIDSELPSQNAGEYYQHFLQGLAFEDDLLERNHIRRALDFKDLQNAHGQRRPIIVQGTEGAMFIEGRLERVEEAYKRGIRNLQLVHEQDDMIAPLGDIYTAPVHLGGLTEFGAKVITECNRLGMLVDLAHGSSDMVMKALKVTTQPPIISHAGLASAVGARVVPAEMQRRLISDDVARAVAAHGGVIGVWSRLVDTMKEYVSAVRGMVKIVGVDHVGIGTDTNITASYVLAYTNQIWPDENGGFFHALVDEMLRQGLTAEEIAKIGGGNFCRVFAKATSAHA